MINILIAIISFIVLLKSAGIFVDQSVALAKKIQVSSFLIGFTLIALGTSLPDLVISTYSTITGHQDITISTFLGSSLVNITLLLGTLGFFVKYKLMEIDIKRNIPLTLLSVGIFVFLLSISNFQMNYVMGIITITMFCISIILANKNNHTITMESTIKFNFVTLLCSSILLMLSGKFCIDNLLEFANKFNITGSTIGFFMLAIGIAIPELITSITVIKKGNLQLSIGNILGATLINILLIPSISSFIVPLDFKPFIFEIIFLLIAIFVFWIFSILGRKYYISKKESIGLVLLYIIFILLRNI